MKRRILLSVLFFFLSAFMANAQFYIGPFGGANMSGLKSDTKTGSEIKWGAGVSIQYHFSDNIAVKAEPMYILKGGSVEATNNNPQIDVKLSMIEIPLQFTYQFSELPSIYLFAGPSIGYNLSAELETELNRILFVAEIDHLTENFELSASGGGGVAIPFSIGKFIIEGRYVYGFTKMANSGPFTAKAGHMTIDGYLETGNNYQTNGIQILAGFLLRL